MKRIIIFFMWMLFFLPGKAQQTYNIVASGSSFSPATLAINQGDIVHFNVGSEHPVLQVNETTWNANGSSVLSGGFSFPSGSGNFNANVPGTYYYICTTHIDAGMKGRIIVGTISPVENYDYKGRFEITPNPANDFIIFNKKSDIPVHELRILDISGKIVQDLSKQNLSQDQFWLDVSSLKKGMYFISFWSDNKRITGKFIKQ